ncbi:MAG: MATE family efflux transporter, partial [Hyphomicrobiaceae bacterium]
SQGSGKILGPVLAQTVRLVVVAVGGWWVTSTGAPLSALFWVVGGALVAYGLAAALAVWLVNWGDAAK